MVQLCDCMEKENTGAYVTMVYWPAENILRPQSAQQ